MIVVLHDLRSAHNVGSIFRTADGAGVDRIILGGYTPGPMDPRGRLRAPFAKVALGAEAMMPWEQRSSTTRFLDRLHRDGWTILALERTPGAVPYADYHPTAAALSKTALVVGNEVEGLPPAVLRRADVVLEIPMRGQKESLNVAVAFGIVAYALLV